MQKRTTNAGVKAAMQMLSQLYTNAAAISDAEVATYLAAKSLMMLQKDGK